jgi:hypothetical protein
MNATAVADITGLLKAGGAEAGHAAYSGAPDVRPIS